MVQVRKLGAPFSKIRYRGRVMGVDSDGTQSVQGVRSHGGPWERGLNTLHFTSSTVADPIEPRRFLPGHPRASLDSLGFYDCHFGINYSRTSWQLFKFSKIPLARDLASG